MASPSEEWGQSKGAGPSPEADLGVHAGIEVVDLLHLLDVSQRERLLQKTVSALGTG